MADQTHGETKSIGLYNGTDHTDDYGTLRVCRTVDCPVDFTSSRRCRRCGHPTVADAYRYEEGA